MTIRWFLFTFMSVWILCFVLLIALIWFQLPFFEARFLCRWISSYFLRRKNRTLKSLRAAANRRHVHIGVALHPHACVDSVRVCACVKRIAKQTSKSNMNRMPYGPPANFPKCVQETRIFMHTLNKTTNSMAGTVNNIFVYVWLWLMMLMLDGRCSHARYAFRYARLVDRSHSHFIIILLSFSLFIR